MDIQGNTCSCGCRTRVSNTNTWERQNKPRDGRPCNTARLARSKAAWLKSVLIEKERPRDILRRIENSKTVNQWLHASWIYLTKSSVTLSGNPAGRNTAISPSLIREAMVWSRCKVWWKVVGMTMLRDRHLNRTSKNWRLYAVTLNWDLHRLIKSAQDSSTSAL